MSAKWDDGLWCTIKNLWMEIIFRINYVKKLDKLCDENPLFFARTVFPPSKSLQSLSTAIKRYASRIDATPLKICCIYFVSQTEAKWHQNRNKEEICARLSRINRQAHSSVDCWPWCKAVWPTTCACVYYTVCGILFYFFDFLLLFHSLYNLISLHQEVLYSFRRRKQSKNITN